MLFGERCSVFGVFGVWCFVQCRLLHLVLFGVLFGRACFVRRFVRTYVVVSVGVRRKSKKPEKPLFQELRQTSREKFESSSDTKFSRDVCLNSSKNGFSRFFDFRRRRHREIVSARHVLFGVLFGKACFVRTCASRCCFVRVRCSVNSVRRLVFIR